MPRDWLYRLWLKKRGGVPPRVPDLELMTPEQRREWRDSAPRNAGIIERAARAFPGRPPRYVQAYRTYLTILLRMDMGDSYEREYKKLPEWAKWRNRFPVEACLLPGKKFKKRVRPNPLKLLALVPAKGKKKGIA